MKTKEEILEAIKNHPNYFLKAVKENPENGFSKRKDCVSHIKRETLSWGSNLVGWVEEKNDRFYPRFNIYD